MRLDSRISLVVATVVLVFLLVGAQLLVNATTAPVNGSGKSTGQAIGHTSFALLGGLRTFAAVTLLNRLDPIHDTYFEAKGQDVSREKYLLPSLRMVTMLDPKFITAYYTASYLMTRNGDPALGVKIAREGVAKNPKSGYLRANLVQELLLQDRRGNMPEMLREARRGLGLDMQWSNANDLFEGLAIFRATFKLAGDTQMVRLMQEADSRLKQTNDMSSIVPILRSLPPASAASTGAAQ